MPRHTHDANPMQRVVRTRTIATATSALVIMSLASCASNVTITPSPQKSEYVQGGYEASFGSALPADVITFPAAGASATVYLAENCGRGAPANAIINCPAEPVEPPFTLTTSSRCPAFVIDAGVDTGSAHEHVVRAQTSSTCTLVATPADTQLDPIEIRVSLAPD